MIMATRSAARCAAAALGAWLVAPGVCAAGETRPPAADRVLLHARIYTADAAHHVAGALALNDGRIAYVGDEAGARAYIGPHTKVRDLHGRLVLPGLIDSHIHPIDTLKTRGCDLASHPVSLAELARFVRACIRRQHTPPGQWVSVRQWSYGFGNAPDAAHPTLRAALDAASTRHPIHLLGDDGHHGAFNSVALAGARNPAGAVVGLSRATLATDFARFAGMAGTDATGEPDGAVNETLQSALDGPDAYAAEREDFAEVMTHPGQVMHQLNAAGITGMLDAALTAARLPFYETLRARDALTVRTTIAQFWEPERFRDERGQIDIAAMVGRATQERDRLRGDPLLRADVVKLFADGGIDGNPYADPPTLPNGAMLAPYLQPRFHVDGQGHPVLDGYVDPDSPACREARAHPEALATPASVAAFRQRNGFQPAQCRISRGELYQPAEELTALVRAFHRAGFALHIHVIGDRAARTAIDAIEAARADGGEDLGRDALAHLEIADPVDVARLGHDHLYVAFTYSWAYVDPEYDITTIPFLSRVTGTDVAALHAPGSYYEANAYPTRGVRDAGGIVLGCSDAPVASRDPRPFVNIARAVSRHAPGQRALNPAQALTLEEAIDSYTIDGARFLGFGAQAGSLEVGKSADFIVLDRDILALGARGDIDPIEGTRVLETWFRGRVVARR